MAKGKSKKKTQGDDQVAIKAAQFLGEEEKTLLQTAKEQLKEGIEKKDLEQMRKAWLLLHHFEENYPASNLQEDEEYRSLVDRAKVFHREWIDSIKEGDMFEYFFTKEDHWYVVKAISIDEKKNAVINFQGWGPKYREKINLNDETVLLNPPETLIKIKPVKRRQSETPVPVPLPSTDSHGAETSDAATIPVVDATPIKDEEETNNHLPSSRENRRARRTQEIPAQKDPINNEKKTTKAKSEKDNNDWKCSICNKCDAGSETPLILCDGPCFRSFHEECLIQRNIPYDKLGSWFCEDCTEGCHVCFVCHTRGADYLDVFKCNVKTCGKYYHQDCLTQEDAPFLQPKITMKKETFIDGAATRFLNNAKKRDDFSNLDLEMKNETTVIYNQSISFKCPHHICDTCFDYHGPVDPSEMNPCDACPRAFHTNCVPPGSRFNKYFFLCPLHPELALPGNPVQDLDLLLMKSDSKVPASHPKFSTTEEVVVKSEPIKKRGRKPSIKTEEIAEEGEEEEEEEEEEEKETNQNINPEELAAVKQIVSSFYDQLPIPLDPPDFTDVYGGQYRLPYAIKEEIEIGPKDFKEIVKNNYDLITKNDMPNDIIPDFGCECKEICDYKCLNRMMHIECSGGKAKSGDLICNVGKHCSNRQLQNREYVSFEVFQEPHMGLGLRSLEFVPKGTLVIEYIGEIINEKEMLKRMENQHRYNPYDKDYYVMQLSDDLYVDGKKQGNFSRFINHSCDPNCELQRWNVGGKIRIGIVAIKDIPEGEPFSYDYQFETQQEDTFKCFCATTKCRGTMAPNSGERLMKLAKSGKDENLRNKLISLGKSKEKDSKSYNKLKEEELERSYTNEYIPGEDKRHFLKNGPLKNTFPFALTQHIFLIRNVMKSNSKFLKRKEYCFPCVSSSSSTSQQQQQQLTSPAAVAAMGNGLNSSNSPKKRSRSARKAPDSSSAADSAIVMSLEKDGSTAAGDAMVDEEIEANEKLDFDTEHSARKKSRPSRYEE